MACIMFLYIAIVLYQAINKNRPWSNMGELSVYYTLYYPCTNIIGKMVTYLLMVVNGLLSCFYIGNWSIMASYQNLWCQGNLLDMR